jgi:tRNA pseudouridine55 synthase
MPPQYSAKKVAGVAAYDHARKNELVDLKPVAVTVTRLEVLSGSPIAHRPSSIDGDGGLLRVRVAASAGFYVRSLAHGIGEALGCGAHLEALRRTRVGRFRVEGALTLDRLEHEGAAAVIGMNELLGEMPAATLTEAALTRAGHGNPVRDDRGIRPGFCRLLQPDGTLLAVAERRPDGLLHPVVVLR